MLGTGLRPEIFSLTKRGRMKWEGARSVSRTRERRAAEVRSLRGLWVRRSEGMRGEERPAWNGD
jgi:hypothetical protein